MLVAIFLQQLLSILGSIGQPLVVLSANHTVEVIPYTTKTPSPLRKMLSGAFYRNFHHFVKACNLRNFPKEPMSATVLKSFRKLDDYNHI